MIVAPDPPLPQVTEKNIDAARESYRPVAFRDFGGEIGRHKPRKRRVSFYKTTAMPCFFGRELLYGQEG